MSKDPIDTAADAAASTQDRPAPGSCERAPRDGSPHPTAPAALSRRAFARRAALATAISPLAAWAPAPASLATTPTSTPPTPATPPPQSTAAPQFSAASQAEADARAQSILAQYASRLSDAQQADIRRLAVLAQSPLDRLRAYHLENSDGPALYLKPLVEREKKPAAPASAAKSTARSAAASKKP
jgi:hypothetical protein